MSGARTSQCQAPSPGTPRPPSTGHQGPGNGPAIPGEDGWYSLPLHLPSTPLPHPQGPLPQLHPTHPHAALSAPHALPPAATPCRLPCPLPPPSPPSPALAPLTGWQRPCGAPPGPRIGGRPREQLGPGAPPRRLQCGVFMASVQVCRWKGPRRVHVRGPRPSRGAVPGSYLMILRTLSQRVCRGGPVALLWSCLFQLTAGLCDVYVYEDNKNMNAPPGHLSGLTPR